MKRPGFIAREKVVHREKTIVCYCKGQIYILKKVCKEHVHEASVRRSLSTETRSATRNQT